MVGLLVIPREMERVTAAWEFGGEGGGLAALVGAKGIWEDPEEGGSWSAGGGEGMDGLD